MFLTMNIISKCNFAYRNLKNPINLSLRVLQEPHSQVNANLLISTLKNQACILLFFLLFLLDLLSLHLPLLTSLATCNHKVQSCNSGEAPFRIKNQVCSSLSYYPNWAPKLANYSSRGNTRLSLSHKCTNSDNITLCTFLPFLRLPSAVITT